MKIWSFIGGLSLLTFFWFLGDSKSVKASKINGVSLESPARKIDSLRFASVKRINPGYVAIIPYAFSFSDKPEVHYDDEHTWWGESYAGTAALIKMAQSEGLGVMLKPHVWISKQGWPGDYQLQSEEDWQVWEKSYKNYIMDFAYLADSLSVEIFCVGTEFRHAVRIRPDFWKSLIRNVREVYEGEITYAANWDNYQKVIFWQELDYIGIDAYWPLDTADLPSRNKLIEEWSHIVDELESFSTQNEKKVLFTEYGYRSVSKTAGPHWQLEDQPYMADGQVVAYQAVFEHLWPEEWFAGGFLWKWRFREGIGGMGDTGYTPQGKPAETTIATFYLAGE